MFEYPRIMRQIQQSYQDHYTFELPANKLCTHYGQDRSYQCGAILGLWGESQQSYCNSFMFQSPVIEWFICTQNCRIDHSKVMLGNWQSDHNSFMFQSPVIRLFVCAQYQQDRSQSLTIMKLFPTQKPQKEEFDYFPVANSGMKQTLSYFRAHLVAVNNEFLLHMLTYCHKLLILGSPFNFW